MPTIRETIIEAIGHQGNTWTILNLFKYLRATNPSTKINSIRSCVRKELVPAGFAIPIGKSGRSLLYKTSVPAETIHEEKADNHKADDDEISAVDFGEKVFRYWRILEEKYNDIKATLEEERKQGSGVIRGLQAENKRLKDDITELRSLNEKRVNKSKYIEVVNENNRLKRLVDEQNVRIKQLNSSTGGKWKMSEIMRQR